MGFTDEKESQDRRKFRLIRGRMGFGECQETRRISSSQKIRPVSNVSALTCCPKFRERVTLKPVSLHPPPPPPQTNHANVPDFPAVNTVVVYPPKVFSTQYTKNITFEKCQTFAASVVTFSQVQPLRSDFSMVRPTKTKQTNTEVFP